MKQLNINIGGMHCASCVSRNENALKKVAGVKSAEVNYALGSAAVEYDETQTSEHALHQVIIDNGYQVVADSANGHQHRQEEIGKIKARAFGSLVLAIPTLILAMFKISFGQNFFGYDASIWLQAILSVITVLVIGREFHVIMLKQLKSFSSSMDTLISLGTLAALIYSFWAMFQGQQEFYFETGAIITALILLGRYFEAKSRGQASQAIEK